jgi:hypothetical protein
MAAYRSAALFALPFLFLESYKFGKTIGLNEIKIIDHTHPVTGPISPIESLKSFARKVGTLETKLDFVV